MLRCPACHALYPDADRFCEVDGETLVQERDKLLSGRPTLPVAPPPPDVPLGAGPALIERARMTRAARIPELVMELGGLARPFERAGLAWQPQPEDFVLTEQGLRLGTARGIFHRSGPFDVRPALRALGEALLDAPVAQGSTAIVRLLSDPTLPSLTIEEALAMMREDELLAPEEADHAAALAHVGYRRKVQQDAVRIGAGEGWTVLVLCDGVSGCVDGGLAARVGSTTACEHLCRSVSAGEGLEPAVREAITAAHLAVYTAAQAPRRLSSRPQSTPLPADRTREAPPSVPAPNEPPGATIVVAAIRGRDMAVGWAGDSRAYLAGASPALLTRDHSWANAMIATGHVTEEEAFAQPLAHALTRCIGPLDDVEPDLVADVVSRTLEPGAAIVLCSDGVWSYMAAPEKLAAVVQAAASPGDPAEVARTLIHEALLRGGHDNASVAVYIAP